MAARRDSRGQLSSLEKLPAEAQHIVVWASGELARRDRTQTEIYAEFIERCAALQAEYRGELEFDIPAFSSFNRHSMRLARLSRRMSEMRELAGAVAKGVDAKTSDDVAIVASESLKALILEMLAAIDGDTYEAKDAMMLASALKSAVQAQHISSDRRRKEEAAYAARVDAAVGAVAKARGITAETAEAIKAQILGVAA